MSVHAATPPALGTPTEAQRMSDAVVTLIDVFTARHSSTTGAHEEALMALTATVSSGFADMRAKQDALAAAVAGLTRRTPSPPAEMPRDESGDTSSGNISEMKSTAIILRAVSEAQGYSLEAISDQMEMDVGAKGAVALNQRNTARNTAPAIQVGRVEAHTPLIQQWRNEIDLRHRLAEDACEIGAVSTRLARLVKAASTAGLLGENNAQKVAQSQITSLAAKFESALAALDRYKKDNAALAKELAEEQAAHSNLRAQLAAEAESLAALANRQRGIDEIRSELTAAIEQFSVVESERSRNEGRGAEPSDPAETLRDLRALHKCVWDREGFNCLTNRPAERQVHDENLHDQIGFLDKYLARLSHEQHDDDKPHDKESLRSQLAAHAERLFTLSHVERVKTHKTAATHGESGKIDGEIDNPELLTVRMDESKQYLGEDDDGHQSEGILGLRISEAEYVQSRASSHIEVLREQLKPLERTCLVHGHDVGAWQAKHDKRLEELKELQNALAKKNVQLAAMTKSARTQQSQLVYMTQELSAMEVKLGVQATEIASLKVQLRAKTTEGAKLQYKLDTLLKVHTPGSSHQGHANAQARVELGMQNNRASARRTKCNAVAAKGIQK
ncbi:hypothetical protein CC85DRAFT_329026 [Cutaneotrichosporon oleaginosum]|uniref:Uncharacterized protein n=1 Tax=Cutaneotrichosporon oleaginosum TaxID=879819 RepID=A0A0J0XK06_9TREE|nr:uncharacterized protein CC85DRAFT_329026 [Cutaneotrichosporon oleaginosum]KLT41416.1 hypothetical protein CC85DRAFT_329026 [Cutaneotrichosporon oleaginosum]TXT12179.1 hypothetical protein COLE_02589 [Cutaneotrichosporon oleaginosum]